MSTTARHPSKDTLKSERNMLDRARAKNQIAAARATRRADEIERGVARSERVVSRAVRQLREAGVIR